MKKIIQPNVRKVYGPSNNTQQESSHMNAVRKIHNLLSSGAVTMTGPTQPRILKQKISTISGVAQPSIQQPNNQSHVVTQISNIHRCYVCDEPAGTHSVSLSEAVTAHSSTKVPNKIAQIIGEAFMVIISVDDVVCKRCITMLNHMDRLETDLERVKTNLLNFIYKKYGLSDDTSVPSSPPVKMQKLNSGNAINRKLLNDDEPDSTILIRKYAVQNVQTRDVIDNQLSNAFDDSEKHQSTSGTTTINQTRIISQSPTLQQTQQQQPAKKGPIKIYKCMSCEFKTTDLKQFQPHYETCKQQNGYRCKTCKKVFANMHSLKQHIAEKHQTDYTCNMCNISFTTELTLKKHMDTQHSETKQQQNQLQHHQQHQQIHHQNEPQTPQHLYSCNMCQYKTTDKQNYDDHLRKHIKVKPFKCRICSLRFETREQAGIHAKSHQPNYFKCGTCSASFPQRELLVKHFETHQVKVTPQPQQQQQHQPQVMTTQKLLQDTIDEALRESADGLDTKGIHFFSCNICSLTFIQENYYNQHMETHKRESKKTTVVTTTTSSTSSSSQSLIRQDVRNSNANILTSTTQSSSISEADIESIFEKMHSEKAENEASNSNGSENLVITSQENAVGGITFNITIPQQETTTNQVKKEQIHEHSDGHLQTTQQQENVSVGIDMPVLDQPEEGSNQQQHTEEKPQVSTSEQQEQVSSGPVSMPSLDDDEEEDGDSQSQPSNTDQVPMDLEDMQNSVESGQIKFILNENGQLIQLDNHIITTDAEGNQIFVQGTDSEQIQQLLQSVGVLQSGDGLDGETLQMIGDNNQMIIVQQGDNEAQLIDASLLNADGHIVIQQAQDGDMSEGAHAIGEDGVRIPVSVAYSTHDHQQSEDVGMHSETSQEQSENSKEQQQQQQQQQSQQQQEEKDQQEQITETGQQDDGTKSESEDNVQDSNVPTSTDQQQQQQSVATTTTQSTLPTSTAGESFFALEDLMQQSDNKPTE